MRLGFLTIALSATMATGAFGQASTHNLLKPNSTTTLLPIWDSNSRQLEGVLVIESGLPGNPQAQIGARPTAIPLRQSGKQTTFFAGLGTLQAPNIGLVCSGLVSTLDALSSRCQFSSGPAASPGFSAGIGVRKNRISVSASAGLQQADVSRQRLPTGFDGLPLASGRIEQHDLRINGSARVGDHGWISIGGTLAKARLVSPSELSGSLPPEWNTGTVSLGAGRGRIGGEVVGRVVDVPGTTDSFQTVGAGVTWQTPWKAKLSVGADNLLTRGRNPLGQGRVADNPASEAIDGAVPFVRYEQDL